MKINLHFVSFKKGPKFGLDICDLYYTKDEVDLFIANNSQIVDSEDITETVNDNQGITSRMGNDTDYQQNPPSLEALRWDSVFQINKISFAPATADKSINAESIDFILSCFTTAKEIDLSLHRDLNYFSDVKLYNLEKINLEKARVSANALQQIFANAENLKEINLHQCKNLDSLDLSDIRLDNLQKIDLSFSDVSVNVVQQIFAKAKNLKEINLHQCKNLDSLVLSNIPLNKLEKINLKSQNISPSVAVHIFSQAVNLKEINLSGCQSLKSLSLLGIPLNNLEEINLDSTAVSEDVMRYIFSQAVNLKEINLSRCERLRNLNLSDMPPLNDLKNIDLSDSNVSADAVRQILRQSENLKKVNLRWCGKLNDLDLSDVKLDGLERIYLSKANISTNAVQQIFRQAKNLKEIDLKFCQNLNSLDLSNISLDNLEKIDLENSNISEKAIIQIISQAKNLKTIDLSPQQALSALSLLKVEIPILFEEAYLPILIDHCKNLKIEEQYDSNSSSISSMNTTPMYKISQQVSASSAEDYNLELNGSLVNINNINELNQAGETALTYSLQAEQIDFKTVKDLINRMRADVRQANKAGLTPLYILVNKYKDTPSVNELIELLIKNGAVVDKNLLTLAKQKGCAHLFPNSPNQTLKRRMDT